MLFSKNLKALKSPWGILEDRRRKEVWSHDRLMDKGIGQAIAVFKLPGRARDIRNGCFSANCSWFLHGYQLRRKQRISFGWWGPRSQQPVKRVWALTVLESKAVHSGSRFNLWQRTLFEPYSKIGRRRTRGRRTSSLKWQERSSLT